MSELIPSHLPGTDPPDSAEFEDHQPAGEGGGHRRKTSEPGNLGVEECLRRLALLPGLISMKVISTAQGNAIRAVYSAILKQHQHQHRQTTGEPQLADESVLDIMRDNPDVLSMLEPLLTDEQVKMVMRHARDGCDQQA